MLVSRCGSTRIWRNLCTPTFPFSVTFFTYTSHIQSFDVSNAGICVLIHPWFPIPLEVYLFYYIVVAYHHGTQEKGEEKCKFPLLSRNCFGWMPYPPPCQSVLPRTRGPSNNYGMRNKIKLPLSENPPPQPHSRVVERLWYMVLPLENIDFVEHTYLLWV